LITFETSNISPEVLSQLIPTTLDLEVIVCKKVPFIGKPSLWYAAHQLKTILKNYNNYSFIARGPFAGYLCQHVKTNNCSQVIIQARGLLAEEYDYTHKKNYLTTFIHAFRKRQFFKLEQHVYTTKNCAIEAVSPALKDYLVTTFKSNPHTITIAQQDIPKKINNTTKKKWRAVMRTKLAIPKYKHVYCYNGSLKPWQCPKETFHFFKQKLKNNQNAFLLILTRDTDLCNNFISTFKLPTESYAIYSVEHQDIYRYLAACDTGIVLRKPHILNWVSRPTKVLEYRALGLEIIHNNTVEYLCD